MGMRKVLGEGGGALGGELEAFHFISFPARWRRAGQDGFQPCGSFPFLLRFVFLFGGGGGRGMCYSVVEQGALVPKTYKLDWFVYFWLVGWLDGG